MHAPDTELQEVQTLFSKLKNKCELLSFAQIISANSDTHSKWMWEPQDDIFRVSESWAAQLGYTMAEAPTSAGEIFELIHPDDRCNLYRGLFNYLDGFSDFFFIAHRVQKKTGDYQWIACQGVVVDRTSSGIPTRIMGMHTIIKYAEAGCSIIYERYKSANDANFHPNLKADL